MGSITPRGSGPRLAGRLGAPGCSKGCPHIQTVLASRRRRRPGRVVRKPLCKPRGDQHPLPSYPQPAFPITLFPDQTAGGRLVKTPRRALSPKTHPTQPTPHNLVSLDCAGAPGVVLSFLSANSNRDPGPAHPLRKYKLHRGAPERVLRFPGTNSLPGLRVKPAGRSPHITGFASVDHISKKAKGNIPTHKKTPAVSRGESIDMISIMGQRKRNAIVCLLLQPVSMAKFQTQFFIALKIAAAFPKKISRLAFYNCTVKLLGALQYDLSM